MTPAPRAVRETLDKILRDLGPVFDFRSLRLTVQTRYDPPKPLLLEVTELPVDQLGEWRPYRDVNVIRVQSGLDATLRLLVILHEISHILLDHLPPSTVTYDEAQRQTVAGHILHRLQADWTGNGDAVWSETEHAAETLARLLLDCIIRKEMALPDLTKDVHGW